MEKTNYQKYMDYIGEWFKGHSLKQRIGNYDDAREKPLTMSEWLSKNCPGDLEQLELF